MCNPYRYVYYHDGSPGQVILCRHAYHEYAHDPEHRMISWIRYNLETEALVIHFPSSKPGRASTFQYSRVPQPMALALLDCSTYDLNGLYLREILAHERLLTCRELGPCFSYGDVCCMNPAIYIDREIPPLRLIVTTAELRLPVVSALAA